MSPNIKNLKLKVDVVPDVPVRKGGYRPLFCLIVPKEFYLSEEGSTLKKVLEHRKKAGHLSKLVERKEKGGTKVLYLWAIPTKSPETEETKEGAIERFTGILTGSSRAIGRIPEDLKIKDLSIE